MLKLLLTFLFALHPAEAQAPIEPPGVRVSGAIPLFQVEPIPPAWVRLESHALADPDCRHYAYEVYSGDSYWLVRYVMIPDDREEFREIEQVLFYPKVKDPSKVKRIPPADLKIDLFAIHWRGSTLQLVERRDLIRD